MSISISSMTAAPVRLTSFLPADSEDLPWSRQLKVLSSEVDDEQKQEVLSNMNTQRLCFTCLVSQKHFRCVSHFLELLRTSGQREKPSARLVPSIGSSEWRETLFVPATIDIGCLSSSSFDGDVNGVPEGPGLWLRVRDESLASHYPRYDSHVDGSLLELTATKLLARFRLRFDDVRLLLTASQCAIVGSSVLHVAHPDLSVVPGSLDVVTACGQGPAIADFFILAASYAVIAGPEQDENVRGAGPRWTLALGSSLRINIIESLTNNPLDVVVAFNFSCVISAWQADGIWLAYPEMTRNGIVVATPASFPMREGLSGRVDVWSVFRKYADLGFEVGLGEFPRSHVCGQDKNCPATVRSSDDDGCRFYAFPEWKFTRDERPPRPTCWSMSGRGCTVGILSGASDVPVLPVFSQESELKAFYAQSVK
ncbi:hypothetical protein R3P38DRAFT_3209585 [Favolaschia claudopus]|uniref:Uncharacterized protein n=1 Tax=Favolaschia claudopus TaxID=2862362 RepID=A0AAW0AJN9_9AGAR